MKNPCISGKIDYRNCNSRRKKNNINNNKHYQYIVEEFALTIPGKKQHNYTKISSHVNVYVINIIIRL